MGVVNPNLAGLERVAEHLRPLLADVVFVGGAIVGLLVDDPGAGGVRPTKDVDLIAQIAGARGYAWATAHMLGLGFQPDQTPGAPACRWTREGLLVDLMGASETPFGATNPWYEEGFRSKVKVRLPGNGLEIFTLSAPVFLLTKWTAYLGRGRGSMPSSHDVEDILVVLDGRQELEREAATANEPVRAGLAAMAQQLLESAQFRDYCLESLGERKALVQERLEAFRSLG